jgi:signal transduction histidine kinase
MQKKKNLLDEKRIAYLASNNISSMYGLIVSTSIIFIILIEDVPKKLLLPWFILSLAQAIGRILFYKNILVRLSNEQIDCAKKTELSFTLLSTLSALTYSCFSISFFFYLSDMTQLLLLVIATGMVAITVNTNASSSKVFIPYTIATMFPFCFWYASRNSIPESYISVFIVIYCFVIIKSSKAVNSYITSFLEAKQDNEHLLLNLKKRKDDLEKTNINLKNHIEKNENLKEKLIKQESLAGLGVLTSGLAHEIRNPLNFIINSATILEEIICEFKENKDELKKCTSIDIEDSIDDALTSINLISQEGSKADAIVSQLLATYEHQKEGSSSRFSVNNLLENITSTIGLALRAEVATSRAVLEFEKDKDLPELTGYEAELSKVIYGILNNSIDAIKEKYSFDPNNYSPLLRIETKYIDQSIEVSIYDNGVGIKDENIAKVFTPFYTTKPTNKATGLGLSSSFEIINDLFKGSVKVDSKLGQFTIVTINLPLESKN